MREFKLNSFDGTPIHCYCWDEVTQPVAVVQLSHGMSEYLGRYEEFARYLNGLGYIVFGDDHRAHGKTETDAQRGRHKGNIFADTVKDLVFIHNYLKAEYGLPQLFLGHSYGSFLGQAFLQQGTDVKGVALCGTAKMAGSQFATLAMWPLQLICKNYRPSFVNAGSDLLFDGRYHEGKGKSQWLTRDLVRRQAFIDNPLCGVNMSINFDWHLLLSAGTLYGKKNVAALNKSTPIAIFGGDMDPIGGTKAAKSKRLHAFYQKAGVEKVSFHLYSGARHELLQETNREEVMQDIASFFSQCLSQE